MRVLQVARYGSVRGGAETYVKTLSEGLRAAGHEVALAYGMEPDAERPEVAAGFHIPQLVEPGAGTSSEGERALRAAVESFRPDVIHVHLPDVPWVPTAARALGPTVLAVHDHRLDSPAGTKYWAAPKRACSIKPGVWCLGYNVFAHCGSLRANLTLKPYRGWRRAQAAARGAHLQVFSSYMRDAVSQAGFPAEQVGVTPYPVPLRAIPDNIANPDPRGRPVVFATGRLNKEKGFHQLIEAMAFCERPAHLVIAGEGHERGALERRAQGVSGPHRITFTGWLTAGELTSWYEEAALVAVPSMWPEPFGIVGLEAMAAARPVVAYASGGIGEWLVDEQTGLLVEPGDIRALGKALQRLLLAPEERARMGEAAARRVAETFSLPAHVTRVLALYEAARA